MPFSMTGIVFNWGNVLFFLLKNDIDTCGKGVVATTLFLFCAAPGILLVVLVRLAGLALMGGLPNRHVSREKISGFSLSEVFFFLFYRLIPLEITKVYLTGI